MKIHYEKLGDALYGEARKMRALAEEHRWYSYFTYVVEVEGKHYMFQYIEDASECQEGQFSELERFGADKDGMVEVQEVEEREVMIVKWMPIYTEQPTP